MKAIKELALELIKATEVNDVARCLELSEHIARILETYKGVVNGRWINYFR